MAYSAGNLEAKLASLNETQESITAVAQWIMFHKRFASSSADVWAKSIADAASNRKLAFVYLANEVIQQSKARRKLECVEFWTKVVPKSVEDAFHSVDQASQDRILRVSRVWRERNVFGQEIQDEIDSRLTTSGDNIPSRSEVPRGASPAVPTALSNLVDLWRQYEKSKSEIESSQLQLQEQWKSEQEDTDSLQLLHKLNKVEFERLQPLATIIQSIRGELDVLATEVNNLTLPDQLGHLSDQKLKTDTRLKKSLPTIESPKVLPLSPKQVTTEYTAKDAMQKFDNSDRDNSELRYEQSSDEDVEDQKVKKPKLDIDPQLASFLASISSSAT